MKRYKYTAKIEQADGGGAYVVFPFDVEKEFGTKGRVPVAATFNGVSYVGSLSKYAGPQHILGVLKSIREQIMAEVGDKIDVEIWKDEVARTVEVSSDFLEALRAADVLEHFESLSYSRRKEYCRSVEEAKLEQTRARRIAKAIASLREKEIVPEPARIRKK